MKKLAIGFALLLSATTAACSSSKDEEPSKQQRAQPAQPAPSAAEVCAKANACLDAMIIADPEQKGTYASVRRSLDRLPADKKASQCRQALSGAKMNPKVAPACK